MGLGVVAEARRQGVARALITAVADLARSRGLKDLSTSTIRETGNVEIFQKLGLHIVSEVPDDYSESDIYEVLSNVELKMAL